MGQHYEETIGDPPTRCLPCDDAVAPLDCVDCQLGEVHMREGYSLSYTQLHQRVIFDQIVGQRAGMMHLELAAPPSHKRLELPFEIPKRGLDNSKRIIHARARWAFVIRFCIYIRS